MAGALEGEHVCRASRLRVSVIAAQQSHWFRVAVGKIVENWAVRDDLGMMRQLGVMPS